MPTKISRATQRRINHVIGDLDAIEVAASRIKNGAIETLFSRAAIPSCPDGFPPSTALDTKSSGGTPGNSPTVGAACARNGEWNGKANRPSEDPLQRQARRFRELVEEAATAIKSAVGVLEEAKIKVEKERGRTTTEPCLVCKELPMEKSGMCQKDYDNWCNYGRPDRAAWVAYHNTLKNSENLILVSECPPPSPGNHARRGPHK